jgi:hypothetical protein
VLRRGTTRCVTDFFVGTFAGSVPEPRCIMQLCAFSLTTRQEHPETMVNFDQMIVGGPTGQRPSALCSR